MPDYTSSSLRGNCLSLNRIYGDPHILSAHNRIKFIENRRRKLPPSIDQRSTNSQPTPNPSSQTNHSEYLLKTLPTEENESEKDLRVTTHR